MALPIFYPDKHFKKSWNFLIFLGVFWFALVVPLKLAMLTLVLPPWALWLNQFFAVLFIVDLFINARTAVYVAGEPVTSQKFLLETYLKGWFLADLLSALPLGWIATSLGYGDWAPLVDLLRLLRVPKASMLLKEAGSFLPMGPFARASLVIYWLTLTINTVACVWVVLYPSDGSMDNLSFFNRALYWSVTTLSSTGYGDITPTDNAGRILAATVMLLGVLFNGFIIASLSSIVIQANAYRLKQQEKLVNLASFFNQFKVPQDLQNAIFSYYAHSATEKAVNSKEIIDSLPEDFQKKVLHRINMHMIEQVPLFKGTSPECLSAFAHVLISEIFNPGQDIIEYGTIGQEMFFLQHGIVEVLTGEGYPVTRLRNNSFFGEIALLGGVKRTATIRAVTICDIYKLAKTDFDRIMDQFPDVKYRLAAQSGQRKVPPAAKKE
ncbi:MAG: cyclic nucleotide-binding domain-containing protein [Magnetococcales bacterium]|nr:cyclic nucleotide-binding domain-containing protein [Magnetococcales bacterium]